MLKNFFYFFIFYFLKKNCYISIDLLAKCSLDVFFYFEYSLRKIDTNKYIFLSVYKKTPGELYHTWKNSRVSGFNFNDYGHKLSSSELVSFFLKYFTANRDKSIVKNPTALYYRYYAFHSITRKSSAFLVSNIFFKKSIIKSMNMLLLMGFLKAKPLVAIDNIVDFDFVKEVFLKLKHDYDFSVVSTKNVHVFIPVLKRKRLPTLALVDGNSNILSVSYPIVVDKLDNFSIYFFTFFFFEYYFTGFHLKEHFLQNSYLNISLNNLKKKIKII